MENRLSVGEVIELINVIETVGEVSSIRDDINEYLYDNPEEYSRFEKTLIYNATTDRIRTILKLQL